MLAGGSVAELSGVAPATSGMAPGATIGLASALSAVLAIAVVILILLSVRYLRRMRQAQPSSNDQPSHSSNFMGENMSMGFNSIRSKFTQPSMDGDSHATLDDLS